MGEAYGELLDKIIRLQDEAERKAWAALAGYKFWMFGYWAATWVKYNQLLPNDGLRKPNPFKGLVAIARDEKEAFDYDPGFEAHLIGPVGRDDGAYVNEHGEVE